MVYFRPGGNRLDRSSIVFMIALGGRQRVRAGPLENADRDRRIEIEIGIGRIVLRRQFDGRDILHAHDRVGGLLDDDIAELVRIGEAA